MEYVDEWYVLLSLGNLKMVLSYESAGYKVSGVYGGKNKYWRTDIMNESYSDDSAVDIKATEKVCSTTKDGGDKDCSESSHIDRYVWNNAKEEFVLK